MLKRYLAKSQSLLLAVLLIFSIFAIGAAALSDDDNESVTFTFSNSEISASDESASGYKISGTDLTINASGT